MVRGFQGEDTIRGFIFKIKTSVPYRFLASRLWPTDGGEHLEQPVADLPLESKYTISVLGWQEKVLMRRILKWMGIQQ